MLTKVDYLTYHTLKPDVRREKISADVSILKMRYMCAHLETDDVFLKVSVASCSPLIECYNSGFLIDPAQVFVQPALWCRLEYLASN